MENRKMNGMRFFKKFILFIFILILLDQLIGTAFKHYYFKQSSHWLYRTTYSLDSTRADVLVVGSSKAVHDYVPGIFEDSLRTTFYNCGRDASQMLYSFAVISAVLERYTPKQIIIDLTSDALSVSEESKLSGLLPYADNPAIKPFLKYNGKFENYKLLSKMYPYNSTITNIIVGSLSSNKTYPSDDRGYVQYDGVWLFPKQLLQDGPIFDYRVKALNDILLKLNQKHVKVTLVISPAYDLYTKDNPNLVLIKNAATRFSNVKFYDYENDTTFASNKLYSDDKHLNGVGAHKFSANLAHRLKQEGVLKDAVIKK